MAAGAEAASVGESKEREKGALLAAISAAVASAEEGIAVVTLAVGVVAATAEAAGE